MLLISNHMIFLVQFEISTCKFFQRLQIALTLRAREILVIFEKIYSCLFISNCTRNHVITYTNLVVLDHSHRIFFFYFQCMIITVIRTA